ncbi:MAG: P-loop NTPase fold protein [Alphaproteobacteria bacterium]
MKFLKDFLCAALYSLCKKQETGPQSSKFVDLAPTSQADENGTYAEALNFATNNTNVFNIALTGPYGSGKSSVIKSFLKEYKKKPNRAALEISLASFVSELDVDDGESSAKSKGRESAVSKQEIERSILQQMLYGADANKLPLSRFKRIQTPSWWAWAFSLLIIFGSASVWHLLQHTSEIGSGDFFKPFEKSNWFNLSAFAFGVLFIWLIIHRLYIQSFGLSLKGISLKDIEIAPKAADEESILNRHLDEIVYFFQSTSYDLVVIEDLDRFDNPEIFVTLREINNLINSNAGVNRHVRFLYALRDDMFGNTDRTKFFEFIVPIVPIINHSNSIDMVLQQGQRLALIERLDQQFLREVSRYLSDLRLIRNVFNEYAIYVQNLESEGENDLDPNKLLAVLIYKNVMPSDFEALHRQKGALASLLWQYDELVERAEADLNEQISEIENEIFQAKNQVPKDLTELQRIYAMALVEKLPANRLYLRYNNQNVPIGQLTGREELGQIITAGRLATAPQQNGGWTQFNVPDIEKLVDERMTYAERRGEIEKKSAKFVAQSGQKLRELKSKISTLRLQPFSEVIPANSQLAEDCFEGLGDNKELMKFLVFEGHLDDSYYQYISLFHEGRLSPHDNKFLRQIRSFNTPEPDFQIDNPAEVIVAMRPEDFGRSYVLNRHLFDCLFGSPSRYQTQISSALRYITTNFEDCDAFFTSYYDRGRKVSALVTSLMAQWREFPAIAAESKQSASHVARLVAYAPESVLSETPFAEGPVAVCLSKNTSEVLGEGVDFELSRLEMLSVEVADLPSIDDFPEVQEHVVDAGLYAISIPNARFILKHSEDSIAPKSLETKHYTTVLKSNNKNLQRSVEADFIRYLRQVLLKQEDNTEEDGSAILAALRHDEVAVEFLEEFWTKQSTILPLLSEVPQHFHTFALEHKRIAASWKNCLTFLSSESFDAERLTAYLADADVMKVLLKKPMPENEEALPLSQFLLNNGGFGNGPYRSYAGILPRKFKDFPADFSSEKLKILVEEERISFSPKSFKSLSETPELQVSFSARNIDAFLGNSSNYEVDDSFRMGLLGTKISDDKKRIVVQDMDPASIATDASRASVVGPILDRTSFEPIKLGFDLVRSLIVNSKPIAIQVSLLNKSQEVLPDEQVRGILAEFDEPYSDIAVFGKSPRIPNTPENRSLAEWLERQQIISSWKPMLTEKELRINTFRSKPQGDETV